MSPFSQQVRFSIRAPGRRVKSDFISFGTCPHERQRDARAAGRSESSDKELLRNGGACKLHKTFRRSQDRGRSERRGVRTSQQEAGGSHTSRRVVRRSAPAKRRTLFGGISWVFRTECRFSGLSRERVSMPWNTDLVRVRHFLRRQTRVRRSHLLIVVDNWLA